MKNIQPAFDAAGYEGPTAMVRVAPAPAPVQQQQQQQQQGDRHGPGWLEHERIKGQQQQMMQQQM